MRIEVEHRYRARDPRVLDRLAEVAELGPAVLGAPRTVAEIDRYLDTPDGRLAAAGWACRLRTRGERSIVSLKGPPEEARADAPGGHDGSLHRRPEVEGPAAAVEGGVHPEAWPASAARERLLDLSAGRPLVERVALAQRRTQRPVRHGGRSLAVLSLDRVTAARAGTTLGELLVVELEQRTGPPDRDGATLLAAVARALAGWPGLEPEPRTKLERALSLAGMPG
ncbi:MAG TPA: CYTH domain-containing protein [Candidatus Limnocylindria bacterium]|nr:CYTH domain-containing protein [Candidatus Limnocylindria bacterium]